MDFPNDVSEQEIKALPLCDSCQRTKQRMHGRVELNAPDSAVAPKAYTCTPSVKAPRIAEAENPSDNALLDSEWIALVAIDEVLRRPLKTLLQGMAFTLERLEAEAKVTNEALHMCLSGILTDVGTLLSLAQELLWRPLP